MRKATLLALLCCTLLGTLLPAQTIRAVPSGSYPTIQSAINASKSGDTVLVSPGTFKENLTVSSIDITLHAPAGPERTIIDGNQAGATLTFNGTVTRKFLLKGFTITGGLGTKGGGIVINNGPSPTIRGCWIMGNRCTQYGAGLGGSYGAPLIEDCRIEDNLAGGSGAASYASGGGVALTGSSSNPNTPELRRCLVKGNTASTRGGGLYFGYAQHCVIEQNTITGNITLGTTGNLDGGSGIFAGLGAVCIIRNNLIYENQSGNNGAGIKFFNVTGMVITNNTIINNQGGSVAGYANAGAFGTNVSAIITNCILWNNGTTEFAFGGRDKNSKAPFVTVTYSDVKGGVTGTGNINLDPKVLNAGSGNLRILPTSPCFNKGINTALKIPTVDFDGNPRIVAATVDMGAFECNPALVYLWADLATLSASKGGKIPYHLHGGTSRAGHLYVVLPGLGGTSPGLMLGTLLLPINLDNSTWILLGAFTSTLTGKLDTSGGALPSMTLPAAIPPAMVGMTLSAAGLIIDNTTLAFSGASNPENVLFIK